MSKSIMTTSENGLSEEIRRALNNFGGEGSLKTIFWSVLSYEREARSTFAGRAS